MSDARSLHELARMRSVTCGPCGARILFARTVNGKDMPLDLEPSEDGNCILYLDGAARLAVEVLGKGKELWPTAQGTRHKPHFATCTKWRRPPPSATT